MEVKVEFKSLADRIKMFGSKGGADNTQTTKTAKKIICEKLIEEIGKMKIYEYPEYPYPEKPYKFIPLNVANNAKIILFLGNAQESFINSFINIYRDISFKDNFRHKIIKLDNSKKEFVIRSFDNSTTIKIISIPFCGVKDEKYMNDIILKISNMKIYFVCYTFDENIDNLNSEQQKEIEFYKNLIHFLNLSDKLIFLCDSKNELKDERINELINKFSTEEKKIEKKIFYLNNKIIYENNNEKENEDEWKKLMDNVNKLKDMIKKEKTKEVKNNEFFEYLLKDNESEVRQYFEKLENKAQNYFNYFLVQIKYEKEKDRSNIFMAIINKIIRKINEGHKTIKLEDDEIEFINDNKYKKIMRILSKIIFKNLKKIIFKNCDLNDEDTFLFNDLIANNLESIDLSVNHIQNLNNSLLNEKVINLKNMNLSNNDINNLSIFTKGNFKNLISLDLSNNKISDIECLGNETNFDKIENINLSNNNIKIIKKVNIKSLKHFDLLNNEINEGIKEFMENNKIYSDSLNLTFNDNSVLFKFENQLNVEFKYKLTEGNYDKFFEELDLKGLKNIKILRSDIINKDISYNINNTKEIKYNDDKKNIILKIINKFEFNQINSIELTESNLNDDNIKLLENLFTENLENINLSNNKIQELSFFTSNETLIKLKKLNLNHNNISNVSCLSNSKLTNLVELNLSFNKIESIDFIESNSNMKKLEKLDLSNNQITKLAKINLKNIKYLNLLDNHLTNGIAEFTQSINNLSHNLILIKLSDSSLRYEYDNNLISQFNYFLKDNNDITQLLKNISFNGIKNLIIKGFDNNNIKFFSNSSLKDLEQLDLKENSLSYISIFDDIKFPEIKKIIVNEKDFNDDSLNNLKLFSSIKVKSITINSERINIKYINPELEINHKNFNILKDNMGKISEFNMDEFPYDLPIFSFENLKNKNLPIFNNIRIKSLNIKYKDGIYSSEMGIEIYSKNYTAKYDFHNLNFMKPSDILSEINDITLNNVTIDDNINIENYKNLNELAFNSCVIENVDIFESIKNKININNLKFTSKNTKCKPNKCMKQGIFEMEKERDMKNISYEYTKSKLTNEDKELRYREPFNFKIIINVDNKYNLIKNANLKNISEINFSNANINNIDFLRNETLRNLRELKLSNNNIEDISLINDDKIYFHDLKLLDLKGNPIKYGLDVFKKKFFNKCLFVKLDLVINESKVIVQFNYLNYSMDIYVNNLNEVSNIFNKDKVFFGYVSTEVANKFKEIFYLSSGEFDKKKEIYYFLTKNSSSYDINTKWFYTLKEEEVRDKKDIIYDTFKILSNNGNNEIELKKLFSNLDIYLNKDKLKIILPNVDIYNFISIDDLKKQTNISLTSLSYIDIKPLCESEYLTNVENLGLYYNGFIDNISYLKYAKFVNLKKLDLDSSHVNNISFLSDVPFTHLEHLDLRNNNINELPYLNFPELKEIHLENNKINLKDNISRLGSSTCKINLKGNYITESMFQGEDIEGRTIIAN